MSTEPVDRLRDLLALHFVSLAIRDLGLLSCGHQLAHLFGYRPGRSTVVRHHHRDITVVEVHIQIRADAWKTAAMSRDAWRRRNLEAISVVCRIQLRFGREQQVYKFRADQLARAQGHRESV